MISIPPSKLSICMQVEATIVEFDEAEEGGDEPGFIFLLYMFCVFQTDRMILYLSKRLLILVSIQLSSDEEDDES